MKFWNAVTVATALVLSTSVNAAIISTDWNAVGDNLITHDTVSALNWLDLTETNNLSYSAVVAQLGAGELYEGFRVATTLEVVALWSNFGVDLSAGVPSYVRSAPDPGIQQASQVLGNIVNEYQSAVYSHGLFGNTLKVPGRDFTYIMGAFINQVEEFNFYNSDADKIAYLSTTNVYTGTYLVSSVPVPAAVWLFASGLIGLVGFARRKSNA